MIHFLFCEGEGVGVPRLANIPNLFCHYSWLFRTVSLGIEVPILLDMDYERRTLSLASNMVFCVIMTIISIGLVFWSALPVHR
jgi:hypothetical protein